RLCSAVSTRYQRTISPDPWAHAIEWRTTAGRGRANSADFPAAGESALHARLLARARTGDLAACQRAAEWAQGHRPGQLPSGFWSYRLRYAPGTRTGQG